MRRYDCNYTTPVSILKKQLKHGITLLLAEPRKYAIPFSHGHVLPDRVGYWRTLPVYTATRTLGFLETWMARPDWEEMQSDTPTSEYGT